MEHKCRRCDKIKPVNKENWHRQSQSKSGFDLTKCKVCANKYLQSRRDGTFQKGAPIPKPRKRPENPFELACLKYKFKLASEPTISIFKEIL